MAKEVPMAVRKDVATKQDLKEFREEIIHRFHIVTEEVLSQVKLVAEGVTNVNEKLERFREETKSEMDNKYGILAGAIQVVNEKVDRTRQELKTEIQAVDGKLENTRQELKTKIQALDEKLENTRQDLKTEIQETRHEVLAAIKFSYAELDRRITFLEKEFLDLKHRVDKIENRPIS